MNTTSVKKSLVREFPRAVLEEEKTGRIRRENKPNSMQLVQDSTFPHEK